MIGILLLFVLSAAKLTIARELCYSTKEFCVPGVSYCTPALYACISCNACCTRIIPNLQYYQTTESNEDCFESCGCEDAANPAASSNTSCGDTNPCNTGYFCSGSSKTCEPCTTGICNKESCDGDDSCWASCCKDLCNSQHPCYGDRYCYDGICEPCPSSCGSWQGACPPECPRTASLSIGNIGFFSVAVVLVVCSCCFCAVNTVRRMYYRRRQRQFQEMLNQPLLVDDDAEIEEGPWDCKSCGHHNVLPTRTCDACGAVRSY